LPEHISGESSATTQRREQQNKDGRAAPSAQPAVRWLLEEENAVRQG
jgi:hypothetical protein